MAGKKVSFGRKPGAVEKPVDVEEWVTNREALVEIDQPPALVETTKPEKIKRLTLDIPESLHKAIKLKATSEGVTMVELLRELLEEHYGSKG
ncbi:toxin-antitoxin system HicB family antitoxin [Oculatella sp. FACHB-28]|uniref:toxin-antitoxin system HicB family antitoxin n=1 Tax=Oculatella sp. FACHB-28 TaxID=2692845 RepID=UPI00168249BB|nr:toxin-antitoxin system HicB family antitoxin [Oculatella sp. FACHB-28]MBD2054466.1 toxin-antitoxin system HicB family antitoxin [Oculatella sp. FACHB-28]